MSEYQNQWERKWRKENPDKAKAKDSRHYQKNKEKIKAQRLVQYFANHEENKEKQRIGARKKWLRRKYGLTPEEFEKMKRSQRNKCALCRTKFDGSFTPHVDHSHKTGKVRGILCPQCNHALGHLRDNWRIAEKAVLYLKERGK